jgi:hypothetical protein
LLPQAIERMQLRKIRSSRGDCLTPLAHRSPLQTLGVKSVFQSGTINMAMNKYRPRHRRISKTCSSHFRICRCLQWELSKTWYKKPASSM